MYRIGINIEEKVARSTKNKIILYTSLITLSVARLKGEALRAEYALGIFLCFD